MAMAWKSPGGALAPLTLAALLGQVLLVQDLPGQDVDLDRRVRRALDKAGPRLAAQSKAATGGHLALVCLAMAHHGFAIDDERFADAIRRLAGTQGLRTYGLSLRLMVAATVRDYPKRRSAAKSDLRRLLSHQKRGSFGYVSSGSRADLSNTQYAALGMRAAVSLGAKVPRSRWESLARSVLGQQQPGGGFGYTRKSGPTPSMTVAGIAVLEVCEQHLNARSGLRKRIGPAIARAWGLMEKSQKSIGAGNVQMNNFYYHYGLERAAILSGRETVGKVDWYASGARMLVGHQGGDGAWGPRGGDRHLRERLVVTAFAVLFLQRKFQAVLTPVTGGRGILTRSLPAQANTKTIDATVKLELARGFRAVPDLIKAMRSPIQARRVAAARALPKITGRFSEYSPYRPVEASEAVIKAAERWWLTEGRKKLLGR